MRTELQALARLRLILRGESASAQSSADQVDAALAAVEGRMCRLERSARLEAARGQLGALRGLQRDWIGHSDGAPGESPESVEALLRSWLDECEAADLLAADDYDGSHISDHCPECGEPEPECVCP